MNTSKTLVAILITIFSTCLFAMNTNSLGQELDVWIGSGGPEGIHHLLLDTNKGTLSKPTVAAPVKSSGFLAMHPTRNFLYSTANKNGEGAVAAFRINRDGDRPKLEEINWQPIGDGGSACVAVDKSGTVLISAQYGGGSVATFKLNKDGSIGPRADLVEHGDGSGVNKRRQAKSHPHWAGTSPDNQFVAIPDLGKDCVVVYKFDTETAKLTTHTEVPVPPGAGPRHMKFHPNEKFVYVLNEMALTISAFSFDAKAGTFTEIETIPTVPESEKDKYLNGSAEIRIHPNGKFVYASNRGHDTISVFSIDEATGKLTQIQREPVRGSWPRNFALDPSGNWLIVGGQHSNTLGLFEVSPETGKITYTRKIVNAPNPICVVFDGE